MSFKVGVGVSNRIDDAHHAGVAATEKAVEKLEGSQSAALMVMASSFFNQEELLRGIRETLPDIPLIGCTTAGAISNAGLHEESVAVMAIASDTIFFHPIKVTDISQNMHKAGVEFGTQVAEKAGGGQKMAFIFSDALSGNGTALVRGALGTLGNDFKLIGGAAADDMQFKKTFQYFGGEILTNAAVGYAVSGAIQFAAGADHGWNPLGNERTVTKANGTTLYELDGKPAFEIYQDYFGERADDFKQALSLAAVSYPLGMQNDESGRFMIRVPLSVADDGSIVCGAELIEGSKISLMIGTLSSALSAAESTTTELSEATAHVSPRLVFVSNCVARKVLYGERLTEEIDMIRRVVGMEANVFGFYSYGQIAPLKETATNVNTCDPGFYEQSISMTILGE